MNGNYLTHPQDLQDAVRGVGNILRVVNSGVYDGIFELSSPDSCPLKILNGLLNLIDNKVMRRRNVTSMEDFQYVSD